MRNKYRNSILSLGALVRVLSRFAEESGVDILTETPATDILVDPTTDAVCGVVTLDGNSQQIPILTDYLVVAEGACGTLSEKIIQKYTLNRASEPQTYGLGIKELWSLNPDSAAALPQKPGFVLHTVGYPYGTHTYGGGFLYLTKHWDLHVGTIIGLDYSNPYQNPYHDFQRFKQHPYIQQFLRNATCVQYGARVINEGGYQSIPQLEFPRGCLLGCSAGLLNVPKVKGVHNAVRSAILAGDAYLRSRSFTQSPTPLHHTYNYTLRNSRVGRELYAARNIRPAFKFGFLPFFIFAAFEQYVARGALPYTVSHHPLTFITHTDMFWRRWLRTLTNFFSPSSVSTILPPNTHTNTLDHITTASVAGVPSKTDSHPPSHHGCASLHDSLTRANLVHRLPHVSHIRVDPNQSHLPALSLLNYAAPETRFCPASVYQFLPTSDGQLKLHINHTNCIHCKACCIKTPYHYLRWHPPASGDGPRYHNM
uniref:Electron transfer flavoprotein-ubiquinone oxidoreductase n=3 Tax=Lygus hesperus TaxID=30085 RepID=A0A146MC89_LYGHE